MLRSSIQNKKTPGTLAKALPQYSKVCVQNRLGDDYGINLMESQIARLASNLKSLKMFAVVCAIYVLHLAMGI